ncbi:MAG: sensor histidine kinase [Clostridium sp.]|uniref:sensor histidine kinase n=1 Tax=Clostridium sp. TaxID=1506 RepID=UPI003D6CEA8C
MKMNRKSIIFKLFCILFTLLLSIYITVGIWTIKDTNKIVKKEMYLMNSQVLGGIGNNILILLSNVETIMDDIAVNNKLIDILSIPNDTILKDKKSTTSMNSYVQGLLIDKVFSYSKFNMKPELYVIGKNGLTYSTYSKTKYDIKGIENDQWYKDIINSKENTVLINTYKDEDGIGPYKYIFKMGRPIKDLITGEVLGVLIIDISEKMLYDRYRESLSDGRYICIVDGNGKVISSKDKRSIGEYYEDAIDKDRGNNIILRDNIEFMKISSDINEDGWRIIEELPLKVIRQPAMQITKRLLIVLLILIILSIGVSYKLSFWITKPILNIKNKMKEVKDGNLKIEIKDKRDDEIGELYDAFNSMVNKLDYYIDEIKREEKEKRMAELSFLQAQINPHFLYNTLSSIRFLISMNKNEEAEEMVYRVTKLLRALLPKANEFITLKEEMHNIKNYVELQKMGYPGKFTFSCDIEEEINNYKVPSFILQPIVENAIIYSMEKENNVGAISVVAYRSHDCIRIVVKDNGIGMSESKIDEVLKKERVLKKKGSVNRVGVINVHERIVLSYGLNYGLSINSIEGKGTKVIFVLPRKEE